MEEETEKQDRVITGVEQSPPDENAIVAVKQESEREAEGKRIGTPILVVVPFEHEGKKYAFKVKPMTSEQECDFAIMFPQASETDKLTSEDMKEIIDVQREILMTNVISTPDGLPITMDYIKQLRADIFQDLVGALTTGGFEKDFRKE